MQDQLTLQLEEMESVVAPSETTYWIGVGVGVAIGVGLIALT